MKRSSMVWLALFVGISGTAQAVTSECQSAQEEAKRRIQAEGLRVVSEDDGIYGSAVKARRTYQIIIDRITGVCPQGAVDYYQQQYDIAMKSACESSATDTLCNEISQQAEISRCDSEMGRLGHKIFTDPGARWDYNGVSYENGYRALVGIADSLRQNGTCSATGLSDRVETWLQQAAAFEQQQSQAEAQRRQRERALAAEREQRRRESEYEDEDYDDGDSSVSFGSILAPVVGTILQQQIQQRQYEGSSGGGESGGYSGSRGSHPCDDEHARGEDCGVE